MSRAAAIEVGQDAVEVRVTIPRGLLDELLAYDDDVGWALRRGARLLLDEEAAQDKRLGTLSARQQRM